MSRKPFLCILHSVVSQYRKNIVEYDAVGLLMVPGVLHMIFTWTMHLLEYF